MHISHRLGSIAALVVTLILLSLGGSGQASKDKKKDTASGGNPVMWEQVDVAQQDTFLGPGGAEMQPDLSSITFVSDRPGGHSLKYNIKDGSGRKWVAKIGDEARPETAAVRLLAAIGYKTEPNYLVPKLTIPGKGDYSNVRLKFRPKDAKEGQWSWSNNPFKGTKEFQGLKIMMAFLNNWDMKQENNVILENGDRLEYVVSDLGVGFGKSGPVGLPIFWRIGRSRDVPEQYAESDFVKNVKSGKIQFSFKGKNTALLNDITKEDGRWLADLLVQLSDKQIEDAFRAANYSDSEVKLLAESVKRRIRALDLATATS
jgi:hypothetical protein